MSSVSLDLYRRTRHSRLDHILYFFGIHQFIINVFISLSRKQDLRRFSHKKTYNVAYERHNGDLADRPDAAALELFQLLGTLAEGRESRSSNLHESVRNVETVRQMEEERGSVIVIVIKEREKASIENAD